MQSVLEGFDEAYVETNTGLEFKKMKRFQIKIVIFQVQKYFDDKYTIPESLKEEALAYAMAYFDALWMAMFSTNCDKPIDLSRVKELRDWIQTYWGSLKTTGQIPVTHGSPRPAGGS